MDQELIRWRTSKWSVPIFINSVNNKYSLKNHADGYTIIFRVLHVISLACGINIKSEILANIDGVVLSNLWFVFRRSWLVEFPWKHSLPRSFFAWQSFFACLSWPRFLFFGQKFCVAIIPPLGLIWIFFWCECVLGMKCGEWSLGFWQSMRWVAWH